MLGDSGDVYFIFCEMYGDTCVVVPHQGCLDEVVWMGVTTYVFPGDVERNTPNFCLGLVLSLV